jgi:hypothetical protein
MTSLMRRFLGGLLAIALALPAPADAAPNERIAVLILPSATGDLALADDLAEVVIARLAETGRYRLVGTRELRQALASGADDRIPSDCLQRPACLGRVGLIAGVRRLVGGNVRSDAGRFLLTLQITDIETGKGGPTFYRSIDEGGVEALVRAAREGIDDLLRPAGEPGELRVETVPAGAMVTIDEQQRGTTPLLVSPVAPGVHRLRIEMDGRFPLKRDLVIAPAESMLISVSDGELERRRRWAPYLAYGSAGAALLSFSAAAFFGTLAGADPDGSTRREAQQDLDLRIGYANVANALLLVGTVLAGTSLYTFVRYRRDLWAE